MSIQFRYIEFHSRMEEALTEHKNNCIAKNTDTTYLENVESRLLLHQYILREYQRVKAS